MANSIPVSAVHQVVSKHPEFDDLLSEVEFSEIATFDLSSSVLRGVSPVLRALSKTPEPIDGDSWLDFSEEMMIAMETEPVDMCSLSESTTIHSKSDLPKFRNSIPANPGCSRQKLKRLSPVEGTSASPPMTANLPTSAKGFEEISNNGTGVGRRRKVDCRFVGYKGRSQKKQEQQLQEAEKIQPVRPPIKLRINLKSKTVSFVNETRNSKEDKPSNPLSMQKIFHFINRYGEEIWICPTCTRPDNGSPMIACDICNLWYHWGCARIDKSPEKNQEWHCRKCLRR